jgi:hypothetical protein
MGRLYWNYKPERKKEAMDDTNTFEPEFDDEWMGSSHWDEKWPTGA